jgi:ketosteroid isomerase-like protein
MYHAYVRGQLKKGFDRLNASQYRAMLLEFPKQFELIFPDFPGRQNANYNLAETLELYGEIFNHFPDLTFRVNSIRVQGWPNYTRVWVDWEGRATEPDGTSFSTTGQHLFHIRWGKVIKLEIQTNTARLKEACLYRRRYLADEAQKVNQLSGSKQHRSIENG